MLVITRHLPLPRHFYAINLCGFILARRPLTETELRHERIHSRQQRELLYVGFLVWYGVEWLCHYARQHDAWAAYQSIRFEREAYQHQGDPAYLKRRRPYQWWGDEEVGR